MPKDLAFTVEFNVKPEFKEEFLASLHDVVENMAKEDTFVATYLHKDANNPNKFVIYERWSEPTFEAFVENQLKGKRYRDEYEANISKWLEKDRGITVLEPIGEWVK